MYTQEEYLYGWLFYLIGVAIIMGCGWWMTSGWRNVELRQILRLSVLVTLLVPWYAAPDLDYLAPAWIIAGFEGVFEEDGAFWRAGAPLLTCLGIAIGVSFLWHLARRIRTR